MNLFENMIGFFNKFYQKKREVKQMKATTNTFPFDTASKLRELIVVHSRRSRHLY